MPRESGRFKPLIDSLRALPDVGEDGFEGMLRDAVASVADRSLRLVKSGSQGGIDMGTDPSKPAPGIAVEAKRYGEHRKLPLDQLKAKLVDAVQRRPQMDLMVFGATREISRDDQDELNRLGDQMGVGVAAIDWPRSSATLPPLAVLCALAPQAVLDRVKSQRSIKSCLDDVRKHADFAAASADLIRGLTRPDMSWGAARNAVAEWLRQSFAARNAAVGRLGTVLNLLDAEVLRVPRIRLSKSIDQWWQNHGAPLALLGEEGVGKSWAALAWWHERAGADGSDLPLTLLIPALEVADADVESLMARLLAQRTGLRDHGFWRRRVNLWLKTPIAETRFLLVIDGLNEHWTFRGWNQIFARLAADPWVNRVAIILTCRPDHWTQELNSLAGVLPPPLVQEVNPFDEDELDALLALHNLTRANFVSDLVPLLRVPRLCNLAIRHRIVMAESGDITRERLIYEDWKDRLDRQSPRLVVGATEFREFVAKLGLRLREHLGEGSALDVSLTRRELTAELGIDSGHGRESLYSTVSEIVDGRWMRSIPEKPHLFRLDKELAPYVLGMALVHALKEAGEVGARDRLAEFMEPLGEGDLGVALLRTAATVGFADPSCGVSLRRMLVDNWFRRQNFRQTDFEVFWRLVPSDLDVFFSLAEETWLRRHGGHQEDEILIKALSNAAERWPAAGERIITWCATWLGTHWADPLEGMVLGYNADTEGVADRSERTKRYRTEWDAFARTVSPHIPIRDGVDGTVAWLAYRIVCILSYLPRASSIPAITAWAVSRAIMGLHPNYDQVAWLLRMPRPDDVPDIPQHFANAAQRLIDLGHPVSVEAARLILAALATPSAARRAEALPRDPAPDWKWPSSIDVDETTGTLHWTRDDGGGAGEAERPPLHRARHLARYATNPDRHLCASDAVILQNLTEATNAASLWLHVDATDDDLAVEQAEVALARWAPTALGELYRRTFATAKHRTEEALNQLGVNTPAHLLLLSRMECESLAAASRQFANSDERAEHARLDLCLAELFGRSAAEQIAVFRGWSNGPNFGKAHSRVLSVPTVNDFEAIAQEIGGERPAPWLCGWLWYLAHVSLEAVPPGYPALVPLLAHEAVEVRRLALEVVYNSNDRDLRQALVNSAWRWTEGMDRREGANGSLILVRGAKESNVAEIRPRIDPHALGFLADRQEASDADLDAFAEFVRRRIEEDFAEVRRSKPYPECNFILNGPVSRLVARRGAEVAQWLRPLLSGTKKPQFGLFVEEFPYVDICRALLRHRPDDGAMLWRSMRDKYDQGIFRSDTFVLLPFEVPLSDPVSELRDVVFNRANTDEEFGKIAAAIIDNDASDWMVGRIRTDLSAASAGMIARGIWMAGMLDASGDAEELWRTALAGPPAPGWLNEVYERARHLYLRNTWAHHWLAGFIQERGRDRAFGLHALFKSCVDRRALAWAPRRLGQVWDILPDLWRVHWSLCWSDLKSAVEKRDRDWKGTLFGTKIAGQVQWPWR